MSYAGGRRVVITSVWGRPESHLSLIRQHPVLSPRMGPGGPEPPTARRAVRWFPVRRAFSPETFPARVLGTMRCYYCGQFHYVDEDGIVADGACAAEQEVKRIG